MEIKQNKFAFFENFKAMADKLPDDLRLKFYDALTDYAFFGKESDDPIINALVTGVKFSLDKADGRSNNGGNHNPKGVNQYKIDQQKEDNLVNSGQSWSIPLETETETRNRNLEKETSKEKVADAPRSPNFKKPTLEEVKTYCQDRGNSVDAEQFMDFYTSKGWKVGNQPMKDWKSCVRTWEKRDKTQSRPVVKDSEPVVSVEREGFYIDSTMPEYRDILTGVNDEIVERCWKWIVDNFEGRAVKVSFIRDMIKKFTSGTEHYKVA